MKPIIFLIITLSCFIASAEDLSKTASEDLKKLRDKGRNIGPCIYSTGGMWTRLSPAQQMKMIQEILETKTEEQPPEQPVVEVSRP